jgi:signal recognition particle receptor subunit beta
VVAVNQFPGAKQYQVSSVRTALDLDPDIPVLLCDARDRQSVKEVLITLLEYVLTARRRDQELAAQR